MATAPTLTFHDGKLEVPDELQQNWKLSEGSVLRVVSSSSSGLIFLKPSGAEKNESGPSSMKAFPEIKSWRDIEGILADTDCDPNADLERERYRELESDSR